MLSFCYFGVPALFSLLYFLAAKITIPFQFSPLFFYARFLFFFRAPAVRFAAVPPLPFPKTCSVL
jgi:hypothetical protein